MDPFDVVIVPDFSGRARVTFEARTLYFLASWMEFGGQSSRFPLQIACIGEPPQTVRELARRAGARISLHESLAPTLGVFANKLRGFEAPNETGRLLLLDVDILILGDLLPLANLVPRDAIGLTLSNGRIILAECFEELYARLGMSLPAKTMADFHSKGDKIYPSYSSGAVLAPKDSDLHDLWVEHITILQEFSKSWAEKLKRNNMLFGDEPALATAMQVLERRGQKVVLMPESFHGKWRHLYQRSPKLSEFQLFHMSSLFAQGTTLEEKLDPTSLFYQNKLFRRYALRWLRHSQSHVRDAVKHFLPASIELLQLRPLFQKLYNGHIRELVH